MDYAHISPEILFLLEGEESISFANVSWKEACLPTEEQIRKKVIGVQLAYACCGEHHGGIQPMAQAFAATSKNGIIKKLPKNFNCYTKDNMTILKYGNEDVSKLAKIAKEVGVAGYWDDNNLIICSTEQYKPIVQNTKGLMQPQKAKFAFRTVFGGRNLMILAV